jgi:hypothetical protein
MGNGQWAMGNGQSEIGDRKSAIGNQPIDNPQLTNRQSAVVIRQ